MLTPQENETLTRVGPGTPMGELMRRYWHPVAAVAQMEDAPTREVRLLGEDLVLYRDRSGSYGLIDRYCAHRRVNLAYGIPEEDGLRCMYHGWKYDATGQCIEQPFEACPEPAERETVRPKGQFKEKINLAGYPVQELGGLLFAYLGPQPAPYLPRWDILVKENLHRHIGYSFCYANWLQTVETSFDPIHLEHLHGRFFQHTLERRQHGELTEEQRAFLKIFRRKHLKVGFDVYKHGIIKRRLLEGETEADEGWAVGHPVLFPNVLRLGGGLVELQFRVPADDDHTMSFWYGAFDPGPDVVLPEQPAIPFHELPHLDGRGGYVADYVDGQDMLSWVAPGPQTDRSREHLGESDAGIILFRKLLREQMDVVRDGGDPMNVFRDWDEAKYIEVEQEKDFYSRTRDASSIKFPDVAWYGPVAREVEDALKRAVRRTE